MTTSSLDPRLWPRLHPLLIAHDVGGSRDRSTAVVGGYCGYVPGILGIKEFNELPQGLYGSARASALAQIDARYDRNALICRRSEQRHQLCRAVDGDLWAAGDWRAYRSPRRRYAGRATAGRSRQCTVYHVGRSHLLEALHSDLQVGRVCFADGPEARRAYAQLEALEPEMREGGIVYKCLPGQHDDLGISCAMLNWAAHHPHLQRWMGNMVAARRPRRRPQPKVELGRLDVTGPPVRQNIIAVVR